MCVSACAVARRRAPGHIPTAGGLARLCSRPPEPRVAPAAAHVADAAPTPVQASPRCLLNRPNLLRSPNPPRVAETPGSHPAIPSPQGLVWAGICPPAVYVFSSYSTCMEPHPTPPPLTHKHTRTRPRPHSAVPYLDAPHIVEDGGRVGRDRQNLIRAVNKVPAQQTTANMLERRAPHRMPVWQTLPRVRVACALTPAPTATRRISTDTVRPSAARAFPPASIVPSNHIHQRNSQPPAGTEPGGPGHEP